jgi:hypothetical protein
MSAALPTSSPTISEATPSATSSPASGAGPTPSSSPVGATDLFGQALAPANHSLLRGNAGATPTSGTSGRSGSVSSASADLSASLANRLAARLDSAGSTLWRSTWSRKVTPLGRAYWAHTASGRRTSGNGSGSWPSPDGGACNSGSDSTWEQRRAKAKVAHDNGNGFGLTLGQASQLTAWPTPSAQLIEAKSNVVKVSGRTPQDPQVGLADAAQLAAWPSPQTPSGGRSVSPDKMDATGRTADGKKHTASLEHAVKFAAPWTTPQHHDATARGKGQKPKHGTKHGCADLNADAQLAAWATPRLEDGESVGMRHQRGTADTLSAQAGQDISGWPSPKAEQDGRTLEQYEEGRMRGYETRKGKTRGGPSSKQGDLAIATQLAACPVCEICGHCHYERDPCWECPEGHPCRRGRKHNEETEGPGPMPSGSPAGTGKPARFLLNPRFSLWLMGYPAAWAHCAERVTRLSRKSRRRS